MTSLHNAMLAVGLDAPPAKVKHTPSGFTRWGKNSRFWLIQGDGAAFFGDYTTGESHQWFEDDDKPLDAERVWHADWSPVIVVIVLSMLQFGWVVFPALGNVMGFINGTVIIGIVIAAIMSRFLARKESNE